MLEWITMPSSRESSWPRDRTHDSLGPALQVDYLLLRPREAPHNLRQSNKMKKKKKRTKISEKNLKGPLGEHQVKWHLHYMGPRRKWEKEPENWIIYHLKTHFFLSTVCMYKYPSHVPVEYIWWWQWLSLLISMIHFIIFFLLLSLGLLCSSFTDFFTCQIRLIIFYLPFLLM